MNRMDKSSPFVCCFISMTLMLVGCVSQKNTLKDTPQYASSYGSATKFEPTAQSSEVLKQLQTENMYEGQALNKDQILNKARSISKSSDSCKGAPARLNVNNAAIYIAESENISIWAAKSIEDYTSQKFDRGAAVNNFNQIVQRSNSLKLWGDTNYVLAACGSKSIVDRIAKSNATKNQLIDTYRQLITN